MGQAVVLVHGVWLGGWTLWPLARRLARRGYEPRVFSYPSVGADLRQNAARLNDFLAPLAGATVHLVGHSLGGILIRALFRYFPLQPAGRIVHLGTPNGGSRVARALARSAPGRRLLGRSLGQFLQEYESWGPLPRELGVIAGDVGLGVGRLLAPLPGPSDGTVTVAETRAPEAADHVVLPVSHTSMLLSRAVAQQVDAFLRTGHFARQR